ncbi:MAG TPA: type II toxin-antitoxin system VapB family antitoxin [Tepidisphaeraceae bacterium]|nr:type II toxin-antitoxin system VapB family antitoxin [Tepidisphaeraceae bacterium]
MRTNIVLDDELVKKAFKCTGAKTKKELVDQALRELVRQNKRADIRELRGKGMLDPTYDYKAARRGR